MKIYCNKFDANRPAPIKVSIPNYSDAKIGVEVYKNDEKVALLSSECSLVDGNTTISADGIRGGYITFPMTVGEDGESKDLTLSCYKGYEVDYDFEVSSSGGGTVSQRVWSYTIPSEMKSLLMNKTLKPNCFDFGISSDIFNQVMFQGSGSSVIGYIGICPYGGYNKWKINNTIYDEIDFNSISASTTLRIGSGKGNVNGTVQVNLKIGDTLYNNFNLTVNSVKSNIIEMESASSTTDIEPVLDTIINGGN